MNIQTQRCILRPVTEADCAQAIRLFTDPAVREFLGGPVPEGWAANKLTQWIAAPEQYFAVTRTADGAFLGAVMLTPHHDGGRQELSYLFLPECWHQGYAREAVPALLSHCRISAALTSVVAETQEKNLRSRRLLEALGFSLEQTVTRFGEAQCIYAIEL